MTNASGSVETILIQRMVLAGARCVMFRDIRWRRITAANEKSMTMTESCAKHCYKTERAARAKLRVLRVKRRKQHAHRIEQRAYQCTHCHRWHLTSQGWSVLGGEG